jgi:DNA-binding CsgD family transcriptional regulator
MSLWQRLLRSLGLQRSGEVVRFDQTLLSVLEDLAEREQRPREAVAADLLSSALDRRGAAETNLNCWRGLTSREQEVAALICLSYTNAEIAARLSISVPTVKTHVRNVLRKFGLSRRSDLRLALAEWDFSAWDRAPR